jgi:alkylation response protein AidB-like acyl-CoA dehydrogenase
VSACADITRVAALLTAAEGNGAAAALLELARQYSGQRVQFGAHIGSFQAIQHLLAESYVLSESAWSSVLFVAAQIDDPSSTVDELTRAVAIAKAYGSTTSREVAQNSMQVFGGIAFTSEHVAHHHLRRALVCGELFGNARHHEQRLGEILTRDLNRVGAVSPA